MSKLAVPIAGLMFAVWAVYLGGLASLQAQCADDGVATLAGIPGIETILPCHKSLRLYWLYMSWEIFVIVAIAGAAVSGKLTQMSQSLVGLLAVALVMFIQASNTFLTAQDLDYYDSGSPEHRIRTITAGSIMVALMNGVAILVVGGAFGDHAPAADREVADKAAPVQTA